MSEVNKSVNHLAKMSEKKYIRKCQQRLQILSRDLFFVTKTSF